MERWPASGALVLVAVGSISGDGTAKQRHEASVIQATGCLVSRTQTLSEENPALGR
jgi:hypothetical protein